MSRKSRLARYLKQSVTKHFHFEVLFNPIERTEPSRYGIPHKDPETPARSSSKERCCNRAVSCFFKQISREAGP